MFREMRRKKQQLSFEECQEILNNEVRGVLSVIGDNGYPYGIPINYKYSTTENKIYFHGAKKGHKIDAIKMNDKVSFTVFEKGIPVESKRGLDVRSVIIFGRIKFIENREKTLSICRNISRQFDFADEDFIEDEIKKFANAVACLELVPEHITGKLINES